MATTRILFVDSLLIEAETPDFEPPSRYDEERDLTLLSDGTPLVDTVRSAGASTFTKNDGERTDADEAGRFLSAGTQTFTNATGERGDDDAQSRWGDTQLDTRRVPADVERD